MQEDTNNKCFICNIERHIFDKLPDYGFARHIENDHNMWKYIFFLVHLQAKDSTEYTGIESYVSAKFETLDMSWLPLHKAICLEEVGTDEEDQKRVKFE